MHFEASSNSSDRCSCDGRACTSGWCYKSWWMHERQLSSFLSWACTWGSILRQGSGQLSGQGSVSAAKCSSRRT
eukprot:scaffold4896_cov149-Skeletonema_dohrnii-CCMP3373.AAC.3